MKYLKKFINKEDYTPSIVSEDTISLIRQPESEDFECMIDGNEEELGLIAAWSAKGKSNDDEDRAILKDLTGNGHDISLNGFAFSEMSGYGGCNYGNTEYHFKKASHYQMIIKWTPPNGNCTFSIKGVTDLFNNFNQIIEVRLRRISDNSIKYIRVDHDGDYDIEVPENIYNGLYMNFGGNTNTVPCDITIKMKINYPDALVFDGVDDYGINENMLTLAELNDYTIICKRNYLSTYVNSACISCRIGGVNDNGGAFQLERESNGSGFVAYSFGKSNTIKLIDSDITYQSKNSYNQKELSSNSLDYSSTTQIVISSIYKEHSNKINMAFYSAYLFDRSLDEQEIKSFIRKYIDPEYLLPSEIPTPDCYYDFSQGSNDDETRDTIKDLSGNGNDAVAHNFAWSGMSGYGGYSMNLKNLWGNDAASYGNKNSTETRINFTPQNSNPIIAFRLYKNYDIPFGKTIKFKVSGILNGRFDVTTQSFLDEGILNSTVSYTNDFSISIPLLEQFNPNDNNSFIGVIYYPNGDTNAILELLPEYEGALVFDGVDDYVSLDAFKGGFKTVFMVCRNFAINKILYDHRETVDNFAIYTENTSIAYDSRNINGTFINNIRNNTLTSNSLLRLKHLIHVKSIRDDGSIKPILGANSKSNSFFANMALYKFLGFKEALTEEQINAIIKKYNLLDGVDDIEVN